jgi:hypothetical protein
MKIQVTLGIEKTTKTMVRMTEIGCEPPELFPALGVTYIKQSVLVKLGNPKTIKVTMEAEN